MLLVVRNVLVVVCFVLLVWCLSFDVCWSLFAVDALRLLLRFDVV